jgi:Tfp pilus assembly protein PilF
MRSRSAWLLVAPLFGFLALHVLGCASVPPLPPKALLLNESGAWALGAGDLATAEARFMVALEYSPRFTEAWVNLGYVELRRGNLDRARRHFIKARDLNPDLPAPHHALGLLADERDPKNETKRIGKEAEAHYRQALKVDPGFVPSRSNLARRLFLRGAFEESREQYLRLTQVEPEALSGYLGLAECHFRLGRDGDADDVIGRARARFGDTPELVMLVARQLLRREAYAEADEILAPLTADADHTRRAAAWAWIGVARLARSDEAGARTAVGEAFAIDKSNEVALAIQRGMR